jgi:hypothetical protein
MYAHILLLTLFATWILATILSQFEGHVSSFKIKRFDPLNLVPCWTFFAPRPCICDYFLVYRDVDGDGSKSDWTDVGLVISRTITSMLWNPYKRRSKCLFDIIQLFSAFNDVNDDLQLTFPYLWSLYVCMKKPRSPLAVRRQFAIAAITHVHNRDDTSVTFVSHEHPFD